MASTDQFYDQRGQTALENIQKTKSLNDVPLYLSAPFAFAFEHLKPSRPNLELLDLGCGTGLHSVHLAKLGYSVTGIDISQASIDAAQALAQIQQVSSNCSFQKMSLEELLKTPFQCDAIFSHGVIYYLNPATVDQLIKNHLRPGGLVVFIETLSDNPVFSLYRRLRQLVRGDRDIKSLKDLLGLKDMHQWDALFSSSEVHGFDFLTLAGVALKRFTKIGRIYHSFAVWADRVLLNRLGCKFLSFKAVLVGKARAG